jgi:hypothetical protein
MDPTEVSSTLTNTYQVRLKRLDKDTHYWVSREEKISLMTVTPGRGPGVQSLKHFFSVTDSGAK